MTARIFDVPPSDEEYLREIILAELWEAMPNAPTYQILKLAERVKAKVWAKGYRHAVRERPDRE